MHVFVANGYHPSTVYSPANEPLRLIFTRADASPCADLLVIARPRLVLRLGLGADTVVDLPPEGAGEVLFNCGGGLHGGRIVRRGRVAAGIRAASSRRLFPWSVVAVPWLLVATTAVAVDAPGLLTWLLGASTSAAGALLIVRGAQRLVAHSSAPGATADARG